MFMTLKGILMTQLILSWIKCGLSEDVSTFLGHTETECELQFQSKLEYCLGLSIFYRKGHPTLTYVKNKNVFIQNVYKEYHCQQYERTLQCIHDNLKACPTPQQTGVVRHYLAEPWALHTNYLCKINQKAQTEDKEHLKFTRTDKDFQEPREHVKFTQTGTEMLFSHDQRGHQSENLDWNAFNIENEILNFKHIRTQLKRGNPDFRRTVTLSANDNQAHLSVINNSRVFASLQTTVDDQHDK
ncbi:uncharacterized protein LOC128231885 isoform X2 [Mya arenaria]|uniref:uncharacterized protein LOC128231885 isoform X2 n=1 Tax=Mya arenaria TaxID=6604 RepID=UPI0022E0A4BC|nr:uncharacterized protein LOC128231885 isoform X2 [Mya arenaria]